LTMLDEVASASITKEGVLEETIEISIYHPFRGMVVTLRLPEGTTMLDSEGRRLKKITVDAVPEPPALPEKWCAVETAYDFWPDGATFDPSIGLTMMYDPLLLPEEVSEWDLSIGYYNSDSAEWVLSYSIIDTEAHTVTTSISHLTIFAIIGTIAPPPLVISDISVSATHNDAIIEWTTDKPSTSQVEYWVTASSQSSSEDTALRTKHIVAVTNLNSETTYHYKVSSSDASGNLVISDENTFTTLTAPDATNWWPFIGGITGAVMVIVVVIAWYFGWHRGGPLWHWWWRRKAKTSEW